MKEILKILTVVMGIIGLASLAFINENKATAHNNRTGKEIFLKMSPKERDVALKDYIEKKKSEKNDRKGVPEFFPCGSSVERIPVGKKSFVGAYEGKRFLFCGDSVCCCGNLRCFRGCI